MRINLNEIPQDGKNYTCNQHSAELTKVLSDLIGNSKYEINFFIKPLSYGFDFSGTAKTQTKEVCSRCGIDIEWPVDIHFHEMLMPKLEVDRTAQYVKPNHFSEITEHDGPGHVEYEGHHFEAGEYIHEAIAIQIPTYPTPEVDPAGKCLGCHLNINKNNFSYDEELTKTKEKSPFDALKDLKTKLKN
jgi:uncharacterized protein